MDDIPVNDSAAIADLVKMLLDAWNHCDGPSFAANFTNSAEYITGDGRQICGREAIAQLATRPQPGPNVTLEGTLQVDRSASAAKVHFGWAMAEDHRLVRRGIIHCTVVRLQDTWLVEELRNEEFTGPEGSPTRV